MLFLFGYLLSFVKAEYLTAPANDIGYVNFNPGFYLIFYDIPADVSIRVGYHDFSDYFVLYTGSIGATFTVRNRNPTPVSIYYTPFDVQYQCDEMRFIANAPYGHSITVSNSGDYSLQSYNNVCLFYANTDVRVSNNLDSDSDVVYYTRRGFYEVSLTEMNTLSSCCGCFM